MGVYLCHGFRWHRDAIRFFVIIQDVDDAAPSWVVAPRSSAALIAQFYDLFEFLPYRSGASGPPTTHGPSGGLDRSTEPPQTGDRSRLRGASVRRGKSPRIVSKTVQRKESPTPATPQAIDPPADEETPVSDWSAVALLEEFDPTNLSVVSGPWAYVADHVVRVDTSVSAVEEMLRYEALENSRDVRAMSGPSDETGRKPGNAERGAAGWFEMLRDKLQANEPIRWYVVVCDDEDRGVESTHLTTEDEDKTIGYTSEGHGPAATEEPVDEGGGNAEFRLPEFLDTKPRPREPRTDWNMVLKKPPAFFKQDPVRDDPHPLLIGAPPKAAPVDPGAPQGRSRTRGLRRLFSKRFRDK